MPATFSRHFLLVRNHFYDSRRSDRQTASWNPWSAAYRAEMGLAFLFARNCCGIYRIHAGS